MNVKKSMNIICIILGISFIQMPNFDLNQLIPDVSKGGPLEVYRKKASFDWKQVKIFFEEPEHINYKKHIWETLRKDTLFTRSDKDQTLEDIKSDAGRRMKRLAEYAFLTQEDMFEDPLKRILFDEATIMWDIDSSIKYSLHFQMFQELIRTMGTERHEYLLKKCETLENYGCFALTEICHGSNTREMKTTAHYDPKTEEFIINTPTLEDSKCWVGNLGKCATHAAVFAQLFTPDGVCHGLNIFIVPIRDQFTLLSLPGVIVGEMGAKAGLNGLDNGFVTFNKVRIPRINLLNRTGDVTPDGRFITPFKDPNKRLGISLGALSNGRVGITFYAHGFMSIALTIAIRYAAVRKQFGPPNEPEMSILEYQLHQYRLLPSLALCFVWKAFSKTFFLNLTELMMGILSKDKSERMAELGKEIHIISCASKPLSSWTTQQIIQECREACGGHGYLKASRFSELRNNNDPLLTFEGDNNVLLQQTSSFLLTIFEEYLKNKVISPTPLMSVDFLNNFDKIMNQKFEPQSQKNLLNYETIMNLFDWLVCYLLKISYEKVEAEGKLGKNSFTSKNNSQVFYLKTLSICFMERTIINRYISIISENENKSLQPVLNKILYLAALHILDKHLLLFYQGGHFSSDKPILLIRETLLKLCAEMKDEAIGLVDAIAPPDYVLNSVLGNSTGDVYNALYNKMVQSPNTFDRLTWYEDFMVKKPFGHLRARL